MMPSAGTLCQLLALGLLVETRLELAAQKLSGGTAHRVLHDDASLVTAAQTEAMAGWLRPRVLAAQPFLCAELVTPELVREVCQRATAVELARGRRALTAGAEGDGWYMVVAGAAEVELPGARL